MCFFLGKKGIEKDLGVVLLLILWRSIAPVLIVTPRLSCLRVYVEVVL